MLRELVAHYGWEDLAFQIRINILNDKDSIPKKRFEALMNITYRGKLLHLT